MVLLVEYLNMWVEGSYLTSLSSGRSPFCRMAIPFVIPEDDIMFV